MSALSNKRSRKFVSTMTTEADPVSKTRKITSDSVAALIRGRQSEERSLCAKCASIDFHSIFALDPASISSDGKRVFDMGLMPLSTAGDVCEFCSLVSAVLTGNRRLPVPDAAGCVPCYLRVFSCLSALGLARTQPRLARSPSLVIVAVPGIYSTQIEISMRDACLTSGLILPTIFPHEAELPVDSLTYLGRSISADKIYFELVRAWIKDCCNSHSTCSEHEKSVPTRDAASQKLLVIDCQTRISTNLPAGQSYIALSYVWGRQDQDFSYLFASEGEELPSPQPQTIEDALSVVEALGERYLWVDRHSIDQSNDQVKQHAILRMADIFENALLTIVALSPSVDAGLWGVSSTHRQKQPSANVGNLQLVSSGPVIQDVLQKSVWSSRGWTFQEALLSRRLLIFSQFQVYWKCMSSTYAESVRGPHHSDAKRKRAGLALDPEIFSENGQYRKRFGERPLPLYVRQVTEYTKRDLTYDSDAINAFRALLTRSTETTFYGIPTFMTLEDGDTRFRLSDLGFIIGLLWSRSAHQWYKTYQEFGNIRKGGPERRVGFPSWSWASTRYCIQFDPLSFRRELSNRNGRLHATTYQEFQFVRGYANIRIPGHGSPSIRCTATQAVAHNVYEPIENILPSSLSLTTIVASWTIDNDLSAAVEDSSVSVVFHFCPSASLRSEQQWFKLGKLFLDLNEDGDMVQSAGYEGRALLLVNFCRQRYHWQNVVWWMAIVPCEEDKWQRIGLIRSVNQVQDPIFPAKDSHTERDREHRRPFLLLANDELPVTGHSPARQILEPHFQTILLS